MKKDMDTNIPSFTMIQRYPEYRVLPPGHPCVTNIFPTYIEKQDRHLSVGKIVSSHESTVSENEMALQDSVVPAESIVDFDFMTEGYALHDLPGFTSEITTPETNPVYDDISTHFGPNERFTGDTLLNYDINTNADLVEKLIPAEETTLLAGPGDTGKTTFYFHLAISIVTKNNEFIGRKINAIYNSVLIIATEDTKKRIAEKVQKQRKIVAPDTLSLKDLIVHVTGENLFKRLRIELSIKRFDLVVLDALGDLLQGDINSQSEVRKFYEQLEKLIREFKTTFLVIHHVNKTRGNSGRSKILGSVAIVDRARNVLMLAKDVKTGIRSLAIEKSNNLPDELKSKPIRLLFDQEALTYSNAPEYMVNEDLDSERLNDNICCITKTATISTTNILSSKRKPGRKLDDEKVKRAIELFKQGHTLEEIGEIVGKDKTTICRWLKKYNSQ